MPETVNCEGPPTLILTNDDGYRAPGIAALRRAVERLALDHAVVAPAEAVSGCGHAVTTHAPLRSRPENAGGWSVEGTPADCVRLALHKFVPDAKWVVSGINAGGNLGVDLFHSGTVAAVREAVFHGHKGVAFSHYIAKDFRIDWNRASDWTAVILEDLLSRELPPRSFWNVNFPCVDTQAPMPEIVFCPWDRSPLPLQYRFDEGEARYEGVYHERNREPDHDVSVCFGGRIAVSLVTL
ncbi:5'/3'-nucleotidase SurE [bacterium]|nr:5'/3'-nucleotidase SurE [bacterium]